jgi:hypothetical protein
MVFLKYCGDEVWHVEKLGFQVGAACALACEVERVTDAQKPEKRKFCLGIPHNIN